MEITYIEMRKQLHSTGFYAKVHNFNEANSHELIMHCVINCCSTSTIGNKTPVTTWKTSVAYLLRAIATEPRAPKSGHHSFILKCHPTKSETRRAASQCSQNKLHCHWWQNSMVSVDRQKRLPASECEGSSIIILWWEPAVGFLSAELNISHFYSLLLYDSLELFILHGICLSH